MALRLSLLGLLILLVLIAVDVRAATVFAVDRHLLLALRHADGVPVGSAKFASAVRDVTALGGATVLTLAVTLTAALLASVGRWRGAP